MGIGGLMILTALIATSSAQEKPVRETRTWQVVTLPSMGWGTAGEVRVDVIDTEGVCLYVSRYGGKSGIAAVPKTQLPKGAGCQ